MVFNEQFVRILLESSFVWIVANEIYFCYTYMAVLLLSFVFAAAYIIMVVPTTFRL